MKPFYTDCLVCLLLLFGGFWVNVSTASPSEINEFARSLIGRDIPSQPIDGPVASLDGCVEESESLVEHFSDGERTHYIISYICRRRTLALLLRRGVDNGSRHVVDAIVLPVKSKSVLFEPFYYVYSCTVKGEPKPTGYVFVLHTGRRVLTAKNGGVRSAWLVNLDTEKFEPMPKNRVACERSDLP